MKDGLGFPYLNRLLVLSYATKILEEPVLWITLGRREFLCDYGFRCVRSKAGTLQIIPPEQIWGTIEEKRQRRNLLSSCFEAEHPKFREMKRKGHGLVALSSAVSSNNRFRFIENDFSPQRVWLDRQRSVTFALKPHSLDVSQFSLLAAGFELRTEARFSLGSSEA